MSQQRHRTRARSLQRLLAACIVAGLVLGSVLAIRDALSLRRHLKGGAAHLQAAEQVLSRSTQNGESFDISAGDLERADTELEAAQVEIGAARSDLAALGLVVAVARRLPVVGSTAAAVPPL